MVQTSTHIIGIDARFASSSLGIGRYTRELVKELAKRDDPWGYVLFGDSDVLEGLIEGDKRFQVSDFRCPQYSVCEQMKFPKLIKRSGIDLLHVPHFNIPFFSSVPIVTTIHDLILHHYPNQTSFLKRFVYRQLMKKAVKRSRQILTVSECTKRDLTDVYGEEVGDKVTVAYPGVSNAFNEPSLVSVRDDTGNVDNKKYILYVGACKEHKNVQTLIDACSYDIDLILVTGGKEVSRLRPRSNTIIKSDVADSVLPSLYRNALCFVTASLYEGFGIPLLEAMACGCPVVAANRGSIPEVLGGFGILVEPTVEGVRHGIEKVAGCRLQVASEAVKYAKGFTWERMAGQVAQVYGSVLESL